MATFTATEPAGVVGDWSNVWTHTFKVNVNPCDNTFTGTGVQTGHDVQGDIPDQHETISGSFGNGTASFTVVGHDNSIQWSLANATTDGRTINLATSDPVVNYPVQFKVTAPVFTTTSDYKNHGQYVSSLGGGSDAAHSCIGMPVNSGE
jgi:hypothetical protein